VSGKKEKKTLSAEELLTRTHSLLFSKKKKTDQEGASHNSIKWVLCTKKRGGTPRPSRVGGRNYTRESNHWGTGGKAGPRRFQTRRKAAGPQKHQEGEDANQIASWEALNEKTIKEYYNLLRRRRNNSLEKEGRSRG